MKLKQLLIHTLDPTPSVAQYQDKASKAAGLFLICIKLLLTGEP